MSDCNKTPLVSIIVPVYNAAKYLKRCIDSLINQTLHNIEIILVDDGSVDDSGALCDRFAENDKRIVAVHIPNSGVSVARNVGMRIAKAKYIGFVDADDAVEKEMYESLYLLTQEIPEVDVCVCDFYNIYNDGHMLVAEHKLEKYYIGSDSVHQGVLARFYGNQTVGLPSVWNKKYRNAFIKTNQIVFPEGVARAEDWMFNYNVFACAKTVASTEKKLYLYYQNMDSAMHIYREKYFQDQKIHISFLLEENKVWKFDIDYCQFYMPIVYKTSMYLLDTFAKAKDPSKKILDILRDPIWHEAIKNTKQRFSKWIEICNKMVLAEQYWLALNTYRLVYFLKRLRHKGV